LYAESLDKKLYDLMLIRNTSVTYGQTDGRQTDDNRAIDARYTV